MANDGINIELVGLNELKRELAKFGPKVEQRARKKGLRRVAVNLRRYFKSQAPKGATGELRKSIKFKVARKRASAWIGLRDRFYYKTLEFGRREHVRGGSLIEEQEPSHPWFMEAWEVVRSRTRQQLVTELRKALYEEARLEYQRSLKRLRRKVIRRIL